MIIVIRTVILYITVVSSLRLMGKKQIGQLEPSELAIAIMISELATMPLSDDATPLLHGIIPVFILAASEITVSAISMKSGKLRRLIAGHPTVIVKDGEILFNSLKSLRFSADDLIMEMRLNGISRFSDIQYAVLETNGQVSFILTKKASPPTARDLQLKVNEEFLPFPVITEGKINPEYLKLIGRGEGWLKKEMKKLGIPGAEKLLLLTAAHSGIDYFLLKDDSI